MDYEKKKISASEAVELAIKPVRLLNIIFRDIKESAELGKRFTVISDIFCDAAVNYIITELTKLQYTVTAEINTDDEYLPTATIKISW